METNMNNELKNKSISDILEASSTDLYEWYLINFKKEIPRSDEIDLLEIGNLLSEVGNYFTYFSSMHSILDSMVKEMKLHKESSDKCKLARNVMTPHSNCFIVHPPLRYPLQRIRLSPLPP